VTVSIIGIRYDRKQFSHERGRRLYSTSEGVTSDHIEVKVENGIRSLTFNRPEKKNAVTLQMAMVFTQALLESNEDENTNIVVLRGTGEYFTSGMDLSKGFSGPPKKPDRDSSAVPPSPAPSKEEPLSTGEKKKRKSGFSIFAAAIMNCEKPLVALVNGPSVGFGVTMLGLMDTVYCSDAATFNTRFTEYGVPPELCSTYTFPRIMGYAKANHILMMNQKITAAEALQCGLVSRVFPNATFQEESWKLVQEHAKLPLKSLLSTKALIRGREREFLHQISRTEQSHFDPEVAREVKRKWAERVEQKSQT
jgi:peroxisomal 3,2-trans-enoyl-CoA isomerase